MSDNASDLARCLARDAEAVCRHYLSNGRRRGRYWVVGDVGNTPGRSLFVRLIGPDSGKGAAGKWTDAATGEHGDLLDLIALNRELERLRDVLDEARSFLSLPRTEPPSDRNRRSTTGADGIARIRTTTVRDVATRLRARSQNRTCAAAASRLCRTPRRCASTRAVITGPMPMRRPKSGRH